MVEGRREGRGKERRRERERKREKERERDPCKRYILTVYSISPGQGLGLTTQLNALDWVLDPDPKPCGAHAL